MGNEDYVTWPYFNKLFSQPCPSVSHVEPGEKYSKFVFMLDHDKKVWNDHYVRSFQQTWQPVVSITSNKMFLQDMVNCS